MTQKKPTGPGALRLSRRAALILPAGLLSGCSTVGDWFTKHKPPLPGKREPVLSASYALTADQGNTQPVTLPAPVVDPAWPQPGGSAAHAPGNLAAGRLARAWRADIGTGGGYRRRVTAQPLVVGGRVFTMDSDAVVTAYALRDGARLWRTETRARHDRSGNVGGGIALDGNTLYAATGRAELVAIDPATGRTRWRRPLPAPARAAPAIADGFLVVPLLGDQLVALSAKDGTQAWSYQSQAMATSVFGQATPAIANGIVVAGFSSGDLLAMRADTGRVIWADSLAAPAARVSLVDFSSVAAMPAIADGRAYAVGLGGLMLALDLRTGRRLWELPAAGSQMPWLAGEWVFLVDSNQQVGAIGRNDGRVRWTTQLPHYDDPESLSGPIYWKGPALVDGRLVLCGTNGQIAVLDAATGRRLGTEDLPDKASVEPVVAERTLLVVTDDGSLTAYR